MLEVTTKLTMDKDGAFEHVELVQGDNIVRLKFNNGLDTLRSFHWENLEKIMNRYKTRVRRDTEDAINDV